MSTFTELIYRHYLIRLNITSENNEFGSNSFQSIVFFNNPHLIALGSKFDPDIKVDLGSSFKQTW